MIYKTVDLSEKYPGATLTTYVLDNPEDVAVPPRRTVIICPGGGYHFLANREAELIVPSYLNAGFNVFLLRYTVGEGAKNYAPLIQASLAIKHVREHAEEYNTDPSYVFITGFSAGGHLAASAGTIWDRPEVLAEMGDAPVGISKPTGMILCYAVILWSHKGTFQYLNGTKTPTEEQIQNFELHRYVTPNTPPAFIWHTFSDGVVNVQNALSFAQALKDNGVPFELHIYPEGPHGLSLCRSDTSGGHEKLIVPHAAGWIDLACNWIRDFK